MYKRNTAVSLILWGLLLVGVLAAAWWLYAKALQVKTRSPVMLRVFVPCGTIGQVYAALDEYKAAHPHITTTEIVDKGKPLARKLEAGEPCDLFIGRPEEVEPLVEKGLLDPDSLRPIAAQILALVVPAENPAGITSLQDLASDRLSRLALAPEKSHPGKYTRQALARLGLAERITAEIVIPASADDMAATVGRDEAEAAILFVSCVQTGVDSAGRPVGTSKIKIVELLPADSHDPIILWAAVPTAAEHPAEAGALAKHLAGDAVRERYFLGAGFRRPPAN